MYLPTFVLSHVEFKVDGTGIRRRYFGDQVLIVGERVGTPIVSRKVSTQFETFLPPLAQSASVWTKFISLLDDKHASTSPNIKKFTGEK